MPAERTPTQNEDILLASEIAQWLRIGLSTVTNGRRPERSHASDSMVSFASFVRTSKHG